MLVALLLLAPAAHAAPPLVPAADVADPDLQVYWRDGELLLGMPLRSDRPALRPLVDLAPSTLPDDLSGYRRLGEACDAVPRATATLDGNPVVAEIGGSLEAPTIVLKGGPVVLAQNKLGRPVVPCTIDIVQADAVPGLEVVVTWRTGVAGPDAADAAAATPTAQPAPPSSEARGVFVFRIPDTAR
jgi:hypothetical protein